MSTLQDRRAAFMAQPITRTLTFQQDELDAFAAWGAREDSKGDKGLPKRRSMPTSSSIGSTSTITK